MKNSIACLSVGILLTSCGGGSSTDVSSSPAPAPSPSPSPSPGPVAITAAMINRDLLNIENRKLGVNEYSEYFHLATRYPENSLLQTYWKRSFSGSTVTYGSFGGAGDSLGVAKFKTFINRIGEISFTTEYVGSGRESMRNKMPDSPLVQIVVDSNAIIPLNVPFLMTSEGIDAPVSYRVIPREAVNSGDGYRLCHELKHKGYPGQIVAGKLETLNVIDREICYHYRADSTILAVTAADSQDGVGDRDAYALTKETNIQHGITGKLITTPSLIRALIVKLDNWEQHAGSFPSGHTSWTIQTGSDRLTEGLALRTPLALHAHYVYEYEANGGVRYKFDPDLNQPPADANGGIRYHFKFDTNHDIAYMSHQGISKFFRDGIPIQLDIPFFASESLRIIPWSTADATVFELCFELLSKGTVAIETCRLHNRSNGEYRFGSTSFYWNSDGRTISFPRQ